MEPADEAALLKSMLTSAEQVLSAAWSGPVRLDARDPRGSSLNGSEIRLDGSARAHSRVMRCSVLASPGPAPATVIVKSFQECAWKDWKGAYDPDDQRQGGTAWRCFNEWAGMQFVERLSRERPLGPRLYGGDRAAGLMVMEDLGEGGCLADLLFGADPVRAEAGLVEAAATVGQLHAASLGRAEEYWELRASLGAYDSDFLWNRRAEYDRQVQEVKRELQAACDSLGVPVPAGMDGEWSSMLTLFERGSLYAFSADLGPDHYRYVDGRPRFIDFEASKYEPAFVDALIGRFVFPSSYLVNRLPPEMAPRMEAAYRTQLVKACPEAGDDRWFNTSLVNAGGLFILSRLVDRPVLAEDLKEDRPWGHASMRQRRLLHLDAFATMTEEFRHLEVLGGLARAGVSAAHALGARARAASLPRLPLRGGTKLGHHPALGVRKVHWQETGVLQPPVVPLQGVAERLDAEVVVLVTSDLHQVVPESNGGDEEKMPVSSSALSTAEAKRVPLPRLHRLFHDLVEQFGVISEHSSDGVRRRRHARVRQCLLEQLLDGHVPGRCQLPGVRECLFV